MATSARVDANPIGLEDGLRHDKWACMMWPRLKLLHELGTSINLSSALAVIVKGDLILVRSRSDSAMFMSAEPRGSPFVG